MELAIRNASGAAGSKKITVSEAAFGQAYNEPLIHQVVVAYQAGARQGSKAQKTRSMVSGGGAKPFRQKGTGRARAGTTRSPIWRKGGVTFAAQPRNHSQKVNRKMYRGAIRSILSELARTERLMVVDSFDVSAPKTKELVGVLKKMDLNDVLIVTDNVTENLYLAARNLPLVDVRDPIDVDPVSLIAYAKVVMTVGAVKYFEEVLA